jgi:hypothetical protein
LKPNKKRKVPHLDVPAEVAVQVRILFMNGASPHFILRQTGVDYETQDKLTSLRVMSGKEFVPAGYKQFAAARGISHTV